MNFKRKQEAEYNHYFYENVKGGEDILLLGVNKSMSQEEATIFFNAPSENYSSEFLVEYLKLNIENRMLIDAVLEQLEETKDNSEFYADYLNVVFDFIFDYFNQTVYDIAENYEDKKYIYDRLSTSLKLKTKPREGNEDTIKEVCALHLLSYDIVKTGKGVMYQLKEEYVQELSKCLSEKYTLKAIQELWSIDKNMSLRDIILKSTGVKEHQLREIPVQIAYQKRLMDDNLEKYLIVFMKELCKRQ